LKKVSIIINGQYYRPNVPLAILSDQDDVPANLIFSGTNFFIRTKQGEYTIQRGKEINDNPLADTFLWRSLYPNLGDNIKDSDIYISPIEH
jgi:hypothetical protein